MSSSHALYCLPSVKKQNMTSRFASLTKHDIEQIVKDNNSQNTKRSTALKYCNFLNHLKRPELSVVSIE